MSKCWELWRTKYYDKVEELRMAESKIEELEMHKVQNLARLGIENRQSEIEARLAAAVRVLRDVWRDGVTAGALKERVKAVVEDNVHSHSTKPEWRPIETAPKDGTTILVIAREMPDHPFVVFWGNAAEIQGPMPALPEGSTIERDWIVNGTEECEEPVYAPSFWQRLPIFNEDQHQGGNKSEEWPVDRSCE